MDTRRTTRVKDDIARDSKAETLPPGNLAKVLEGIVAALKSLPETSDRSTWFPRGIDLVQLGVDVKCGRVDVIISGGPAPGAASSFAAQARLQGLPTLDLLAGGDLKPGEMVPNRSERSAIGGATTVIKRGTPEFGALVSNTNPNVVFKDEEGTGSDRMMTMKLSARVDALAALVAQEWTGTRLRITEAWDENMEHGTNSVHYEARAIDMTTMPVDGSKLGRLGRLAVNSGFEWVFFENALHVHASMSK
jgi:hypothetical protein